VNETEVTASPLTLSGVESGLCDIPVALVVVCLHLPGRSLSVTQLRLHLSRIKQTQHSVIFAYSTRKEFWLS